MFTEKVGFVTPETRANRIWSVRDMGLEADDFVTYIRYSMPNDPTLGEQWREQLPLTILRVRDLKGGKAKRRFQNLSHTRQRTGSYDETCLKG